MYVFVSRGRLSAVAVGSNATLLLQIGKTLKDASWLEERVAASNAAQSPASDTTGTGTWPAYPSMESRACSDMEGGINILATPPSVLSL